MKRMLLFSYSGFSDENANGITMKNLLSAWEPSDLAEFYCDVQPPDFTAAHTCFRVTDTQAIKACFGKSSRHVFCYEAQEGKGAEAGKKTAGSPKRIPAWLKKHKYNFVLKWLREYMWMLSPWGHRQLEDWVDAFQPDVLMYMVGESIFMDRLVLKFCRKTGKPLVLYNGEAYRIIQLKERRGLERLYYRKTQQLYRKLNERADLVVYNCKMLQEDYEKRYPAGCGTMIAYNTADPISRPYVPNDPMRITYFGNMGVGRSDVLLQAAKVLNRVDPALRLDVYGNAQEEYVLKFAQAGNINYHGFVDGGTLRQLIAESDILLHVESFDPQIMHRLRYAFSTKIAQCMCSGRCFISFAPGESASSQYLASVGGAKLVSDETALYDLLKRLTSDRELRRTYAREAYRVGLKNHLREAVAVQVKTKLETL